MEMLVKKHPLYYTWWGMKKRCSSKTNVNYKHYGAKGIKVCDEWLDFWTFIKDMGPRPSPKHSLDRLDSKKGYSKENCRWATQQQQVENRRISYECLKGHKWTKKTVMITHNGVRQTRRCRICYENRMKPTARSEEDGNG